MRTAGTLTQLISGHLRRRFVAYFFVVAVLAAGLNTGAAATRSVSAAVKDEIASALTAFLADNNGTAVRPSQAEIVHEALTGDILRTAVLIWVLGLSVIGAPVILFITFLRGFAVGFTFGLLLEQMAWRGLVLAFASLLPHNIPALLALVIAGAAGLTFAGVAGRILVGRHTGYTVYGQFAASAALTAFAAVLILLGLFVEAYITPALIDLTTRFFL